VPQPAPRISYLDIDWAEELLAYCIAQRASTRSSETASRPGWRQTEQALLGGYCRDAGWLAYALGQPIQAVRQNWREAAQAYLEVFRLRNTTQPIGVVQVKATPGWQSRFNPAEEPESTAAGQPDNSLTNPELGLLALHLALASGAKDVAALLAQEMTSPASDQSSTDWLLCLSLAGLILNQESTAASQASRAIQSHEEPVRLEAAAIFSLAGNQQNLFLAAIDRLLEAHEATVRYRSSNKQMELFLCLPATALAALALDRRAITLVDIPVAISPLLLDFQAGAQ